MNKFQNKYCIPSVRLQNWDYGWDASYFVTICTKNRDHFFGKIRDGKMILSEIGEKANKFWLEIPEYSPFVKFDVHVIMLNHVHGIILIDKPDDSRNGNNNLNEKRIVGSIVESKIVRLYKIFRLYRHHHRHQNNNQKTNLARNPKSDIHHSWI